MGGPCWPYGSLQMPSLLAYCHMRRLCAHPRALFTACLGHSSNPPFSTLYAHRARDWVVNKLSFDRDTSVSLFETIIRVSGGLLSAHDLTGDPALLAKARDLADRLAPAFLTCPETGIPDNVARLPFTHPGACNGVAVLAELGSATLEWGALSQRSGNATYRRLVEAPVRWLWEKHQDKVRLGR